MAWVKTSWISISLVFTLIACSQTVIITIETPTPITSATPGAAGVEAAFASPTPWVGGTQTALAAAAAETQSQSSLPPPTQEIMEEPTDFSPVLYGGKLYETPFFLLLGGVSRDTWLVPEVSVARFSGEMTYSLHDFTQEYRYFLWGKAPEFSPTCKAYSVATDASLEEAGFVAVADGWAVTKREVTELSGDGLFYEQVVSDWLRAEGVSSPQVDSVHVYRVDIEGDGTDEVFISTTHLDDSQHMTKAGDYSIVLMRKVIGNDAITKLVVGDVYHSQDLEMTYPRTYSLANFIDLNQDGQLEIVVEVLKWEGFGARVFQIDGDAVVQILGAEC